MLVFVQAPLWLFCHVKEFTVLGGAEEIGANCFHYNLFGTGIVVDAGLHPRERGYRTFPELEYISGKPVDHLLITHAHSDHLGGVPYVLRRHPNVRICMTRATRDLSHVMLNNNGRLLRGEVTAHFTKEQLEYYQREQIQLVRSSFDAADYKEPFVITGYSGQPVTAAFHWAGHILGSAGVVFESNGFRILHTADVQFQPQSIIKSAQLPRVHADVVVTEATNCASNFPIDYQGESQKLSRFITQISSQGGSVLIPCFALGKTQEIVSRLYQLMHQGSIPRLPIYTGGMATAISQVYDSYCYTEPFNRPGFKLADVPQEKLSWETLHTNEYLKSPGIVVASSGMVNKRTMSYVLAKYWMREPTFGIAFIGYQDPSTPGYQLLHSEKNKAFDFGGKEFKRLCAIESFRFSAHAAQEDLVGFITDCTPHTVVIVHGEREACEGLALALRMRMPGLRIIIPRIGITYNLANEQWESDE